MNLLFRAVLAVFAVLPLSIASAQQFQQTIRGTIVDRDSQIPLTGATVLVVDSNPVIGAVSDLEGHFRITNVPIGRVTLKVSFMGYEDQTFPNLLITSAKEEILTITLAESVHALEAITIEAEDERNIALNEMAIVSAHTFSVEETQRFAGSFDDPARMVVAFAGVNGNAEGDNDIIVRGNSPKGILWRLEGVAIPNPNHFANEGSTGGPINALSSRMLSNSDFFTGAFAPEYGDVTSGVFDMKLKTGNNEKREYTAAVSTLGLDVTAEGPFREGKRASYLANYRYSALDLLDKAGVVDFGGVPRYQDLSFKVQVPVNARHNMSVFGLGGRSGIDTEETDAEDETRITGKFAGINMLGVFGIGHVFQINDDMYLKSSVAATGSGNDFSFVVPDDDEVFYTVDKGSISRSSIIVASSYNYKINAKHKLEGGIIFTRLNYDMDVDAWDPETDQLVNQIADNGSSATLQSFASWKYRVTEDLTMIGGVHWLRFALNKNFSIEPRLAMKWQVNEAQSFQVGAGLHSKLETLSTYLARQHAPDGTINQWNRDLGIGKAAHLVVGYDRQIGQYTHLKLEAYYQDLYDVPVEDSDSSAFSLQNLSDGYSTRRLVNAGSGKNYGLEFTVERYFHDGLYYMGTLSLFRSLYTAKDGIERKSAFDNQYVANLIGGKEFAVGNSSKNKVLFLNTKLVLIGGKRYSPIDLEASIAAGTGVIDERNPYSRKGDDIFRADFSIGLRRNRKTVTTEWKIDVQNILNNQTVLGEGYLPVTESLYYATQLGLLPTISYKVSF